MPLSRRDKQTRQVMKRLEAVLDELREVIEELREAAETGAEPLREVRSGTDEEG